MDKGLVTTPKVSVVLPVYNGGSYLREAVDSILGQSFTEFELIIINDGSTDSTGKILASYKDPRIKIYAQKNQGLVASLNRGIDLASASYIARQDADDRSEPSRLSVQYKYLVANPEIILVGSCMSVMNLDSKILHRHAVLLNDSELKQELFIRSPFAHGSVMFSKKAVIKAGLYRKDYWPAEDYDLWLRMSRLGSFANIDDHLYVYRENESGISSLNQQPQLSQTVRIQKDAWIQKWQILPKRNIQLSKYRSKDLNDMRISRIISNVSWVARQAIKNGEYLFAVRNLRLVMASPLIYHKLAGKIKRRRHGQ